MPFFVIGKGLGMKFISPKMDFCMKQLFQNEVVRKYFLSDVLDIPVKDNRSTRIQNTFLWKRYRNQKLGILDVLMEMNDNTKINVSAPIEFRKPLHGQSTPQCVVCRIQQRQGCIFPVGG